MKDWLEIALPYLAKRLEERGGTVLTALQRQLQESLNWMILQGLTGPILSMLMRNQQVNRPSRHNRDRIATIELRIAVGVADDSCCVLTLSASRLTEPLWSELGRGIFV
jgi:hypothetical protein